MLLLSHGHRCSCLGQGKPIQPLELLFYSGHSLQSLPSPCQPVPRTQTPASAGADLLPGDTLTCENTSQNLTAMLCNMALGWQNAQGSSQAKKAVGCPTHPAMVSQVLMELPRCSWPLGSPAQAVPHAMAAPAHGRAVY